MVAAGHPLAAEAGMRILKAGGNAVDAAMATWAVQGEVEPGMTGLGADMFVLIYLAKTGEVKFINGTGFAPQAATIDFYKSKGGIPDDGPLSISVPGAVGGAAFAVQKYGTKPLADVLAPAIEIAEQGFPITEALAQGLASGRAKLEKFPSTTKIWFKDGKPLADGRHPRQPGSRANAAGDRIAGAGCVLSRRHREEDRRVPEIERRHHHRSATSPSYQPFEDTPIRTNYRGVDVYECPPNSQGFVMLEALNILEGFDLKRDGSQHARRTCTPSPKR